MTALVFDTVGERGYETGVSACVLYPFDVSDEDGEHNPYPLGVAWNGITVITESPSGADATPLYADNIKYLNLIAAEEFAATIEAYTYPDEFAPCDGSVIVTAAKGVKIGQQPRLGFGLAYKTKSGNDSDPEAGYKIHLVYGAKAAPSQKAYNTVNDKPEAIAFSWSISTTPVSFESDGDNTDLKPTAIIIIDSLTADETCLAALEAILYGSTAGDGPYLPLPDEVITLMTPAGGGAD